MGRIKEESNAFNGNFDGILDHNGIVKVARGEIRATILNIQKRNVLVKGKNGSYVAEIHKDLYTFMDFVEKGDCAFIKWKTGKPWFIGFQKQKAHEQIQSRYIDEDENCNWNEFFRGVDVE